MIKLQNVGLRYGRGQEVLRDVSFHLRPGSFHFLTGPSGAGKSSLLRMLFLSQQPSRRFGTPDEIAKCAVFLASPAAGWVVGTSRRSMCA